MQLILKTWRQTPLFAVCFSSLSDMSKKLSCSVCVMCFYLQRTVSPCHRAKHRLRLKWNGDADCWQNIAGFPYDWPLWIFFSLCTDFHKLVCVCLPNICHIYHKDFFIAILTVYKRSVGSSGSTQPEGGCLNCPHLPFDWQEQVVAH